MNRREKIVFRAVDQPTAEAGQEFSSEGCVGMRLFLNVTSMYLTRATFTTALAGLNNDLKFTAVPVGVAGNAVQFRYTSAAGINQLTTVTVASNSVSVWLGTGPTGVVNATANQVLAAIRASTAAMAFLTPELAGADDGTGVVAAISYTSLTGGTDGGSVTFKLQIKEPSSGIWIDFPGAAFVAGGVAAQTMVIYPGIPVAANTSLNQVISGGLRMLPFGLTGRMFATVTAQFIE